MSGPDRSAYDFSLTIEGVEYPFVLALDDNGQKQMNDGLAPIIAPQVRTGGFGYSHVPPDIEVIHSFETFVGGCGFDKPKPDPLSPYGIALANDIIHYNYTRGVDLSFGDTAFVALKRRAVLESDGTAIASAPVKFCSTTLGFFMLAGAYIYQWDLATTAWVERDNASATFSGAAYTDMVELDGTVYAARGSTADYKYSTTGTTWTAFTDADENADVFTVRGNGSDVASVWKVLINIIKATADAKNSGVAWAGGDEIGHTSETVRSAITVDNDIYTFKKEGFYRYDGTNTQDVWKTQYLDTTNGKQAYLWVNGKIYMTYGRRLLEFDPNSNAVSTLRPVFPTPGMDSLEVLGSVTAVGGDDTHLYVAVKNQAGNTYILKGQESSSGEWIWHSICYLGANDCNALFLVGPGIMHATNPCLVFGYGTAAHYRVHPQQGLHPNEDPACTFETDEGFARISNVDFGAKTFTKFLNRGSVLGYGLSGGRYATLSYEADRNGTITTLVSATNEGITDTNEASEVEFNIVAPVLYMGTGDASTSPRVDAFALGATPNPTRHRQWAPVVVLSDNLEGRGGSDPDDANPSAVTTRRALFGAVNKRITLTDRDRLSYTARLLDIQPVGVKDRTNGGHEYETVGYKLTVVGINLLSSDETVGIYDESDYDAGHVWGDV